MIMGGCLAITLREKDGREFRMSRWTNASPFLIDNIDLETAKIKEKEFIKLYGRKDLKLGCLCNMTDGGEGCNPSPEVREKLRQSKLGNKNPNYKKIMSQDFKDKISRATSGSKNPFFGKKHKPGTLVNNCKIVLNLETGIYYDSMKEAHLVTKYKYKCFKAMLNGQSRNKT